MRQIDSPVQGHPIQGCLPGVEATTGSLGQGLSLGLGHVLAGRRNGLDYQVYVVLGDGECDAGQIWAAAMAAAHYHSGGLTAIIEYNKYQETRPSTREMALEPLVRKWQSFGWLVYEVGGHDVEELVLSLRLCRQLRATGKPQIIIAHTIKGKGVSFVEADSTYHGRALKADLAEKAREELGAIGS